MNPAHPMHTTARSRRRSRASTIQRETLLPRISHYSTVALLACFSIFIGMLLALTIYGVTRVDKAYAGITIAGLDVSGMNRTEISSMLDRTLYDYEKGPVTLVANDRQFTSSLSDFGVSIDKEATIERAMSYGRSGSWWDRSTEWSRVLFDKQDVDPVVTIDASTFQQQLQTFAPDVVIAPQNAYVQIEGSGEPTLVADVPGTAINVDATRSLLMENVRNLESDPVAISLLSVPAAVNSAAIESGLPNAQRAVSHAVNLQSDEGTWPIGPDVLKSLVWVDDRGELNVREDAARSVIEGVAAEIDHPAQDAGITVDGNGNFVTVPAIFSAEVDIEASATALMDSLIHGETEVPIVVTRSAPLIVDEMAQEWAGRADRLAGEGVTVSWSGESAPVSRGELIWAMVIDPQPGESDPFNLYFDQDVLAEQMQPIADSVYHAPKDAEFRLVDGEIRLHAEAGEGRQVDLSASANAVDEAATSGSFTANLVIDKIEPNYTAADRDDINLDDALGDSTTYYGDSSGPRRHNVERAVQLEHGWLIPPGGEFSFASVIGLVTPENGFVTGYGIVADPNGGVTTAPVVGGGICQVSTTIFQAAWWAGLEITERYQHPYWLLAYGEAPRGMEGLDAMVNIEPDWALDLKFRNTTSDWIAVVMTADGETVGAQILGVDQGWDVSVDQPRITNIVKSDPKMIYTDSTELPVGEELQVEHAKDGFDSAIKRTVRDENGIIISEYTLESSFAASRNMTLRGTGAGSDNVIG